MPSGAPAESGEGAVGWVLFVAGEPYHDANPGGTRPVMTLALPMGVPLARSWGTHEPGDVQPGQIYGRNAAVARLVLTVARQHRIPVHVVDVDNPGRNAELVGRLLSGDEAYPVLVRPDGGRLAGSESFVPEVVERFFGVP